MTAHADDEIAPAVEGVEEDAEGRRRGLTETTTTRRIRNAESSGAGGARG